MSDVPEFKYLIVGGGLAAASAVDGIRQEDPEGSILLLAEEEEPPYHRPPLSKEYLQDPEATRDMLHVKPEGWFDSQDNLEFASRDPVLQLDAGAMRVITARGKQYRGEKILLATGGRPRRLGVPGERLDGVFTFRTVGDSEAVREAARQAERAVLVGAGFIGMEISASLTKYDVRSVVLEEGPAVWPRVLPPELAGWMRRVFEGHGIGFRLSTRADAFEGADRVEAVRAGSERLPCDLAVVGVGIEPCVELAVDAGLLITDGIQVDDRGETSHVGIFAAGDVARVPDPFDGGSRRIEHWEHAREHGRLVGRNMAGADEPYLRLTYFFSDVFDLSLNILGSPSGAERLVHRGTPGDGPSIAFGVDAGRITSAVMVNVSKPLETCRTLVRLRPRVEEIEDRLADPDGSLEELAGELEGAEGG